MKKTVTFFGLTFMLAFAAAAPTRAFATEKVDIVSGLNTLPLLVDKISGNTIMAIVYNPADAGSKADAEHMKKIIDGGIDVPDGGKLSAIMVSVHELSKLSRARVAFLSSGLSDYYDSVNVATSAASILTFTTDVKCVAAGKCIIGVETTPKLSLYYSKQAADNAKIQFTQAFSMVVKQP